MKFSTKFQKFFKKFKIADYSTFGNSNISLMEKTLLNSKFSSVFILLPFLLSEKINHIQLCKNLKLSCD